MKIRISTTVSEESENAQRKNSGEYRPQKRHGQKKQNPESQAVTSPSGKHFWTLSGGPFFCVWLCRPLWNNDLMTKWIFWILYLFLGKHKQIFKHFQETAKAFIHLWSPDRRVTRVGFFLAPATNSDRLKVPSLFLSIALNKLAVMSFAERDCLSPAGLCNRKIAWK